MTRPELAEEDEASEVATGAEIVALPRDRLSGQGSLQPGGTKLPRRRAKRALLPALALVAVWVLVSVAVLAAWGAVYLAMVGGVQEHRDQRVLLAEFKGNAAAGTVPVGGKIAPGTPVALAQIPSIGVRNLVVVEGTTSGQLEAGPGHRRDTPLPGEVGTSFVLGRSSGFGGPFASITRLKKGDTIGVTTGEGVFSFGVDAVRRPGDSLSAFDPGAARLTLVTSERTKGGLRQVVYVDATLTKGGGQPASEGRPASIPDAERQMRGDPGAWLGIVLWLEGLVVAAVALTWTRNRWGLVPVLIVGAPVVLAAIWGLAQAGGQLLPNLL